MGLPIVKVNITLRTATISKAGFGVMMFLSAHKAFGERVRSYSSLSAVAEDFGENDEAYKAARMYFSNTPAPDTLKVGRIDGDSMLSPQAAGDAGVEYSITITVGGENYTFDYLSSGVETEQTVASALAGEISNEAELTGKIVVSLENSGETIQIKEGTHGFTVKVSDNIGNELNTTESYVEALTACTDEDGDYYALATSARSKADVKAIAANVETMSRVYIVALADTNALVTLSDGSTDTFAELAELSYTRTAGIYSQIANEDYPECIYWGHNATYSPDEQAVVWDSLELSGVPLARDGQNKVLTETQRNALDARNISYVARTAAGNRIIGGKMVGGEWIDNIQNADCIEARVTESLELLFLNQKGKKVVGGNAGLLQCKASITSALEPFVASQAIDVYEVDTKDAQIDFRTRTVTNLKFNAILTGAILRAVVNGSLEN